MNLSDFSITEGVRSRLESALQRMSHAYMISGPSKCSTQALADYIAAVFVCSGAGDKPCGICPDCRKAHGNIHPDIIHISILEDKKEIIVEQIRQLRADAYVRPNEADRKVFVIHDAQTMNDHAQNALLKILEDGPGYLSFLLLTDNPQKLLPTIRSRCESLSMVPNVEEQPAVKESVQKTAQELVEVLLSGAEKQLAEYAAGLEKKKLEREDLLSLLGMAEDLLRSELRKRPQEVFSLMEHIKRVRHAAEGRMGTGHVLGLLAAGR